MSVFSVLVLATTISVSLQLNCGTNYTYVVEWERNWCAVQNCYYDEKTESCRECSACNQVFRLESDGPMLQCLVEHSDHHLCAPSELTFSSFFEDKMALPICFIASLLFTMLVIVGMSSMANHCILNKCYWLPKIQKTSRYISGERLKNIEIRKLYRHVAKKVEKIANSLSIQIRDIKPVGGDQYSREELSFRFLARLSNSENDIAKIAQTFCKVGYGELLYRVFTNHDIVEPEVPDDQHDLMKPEVILNLCDKLYKHPDYARYQFEIAIELHFDLPDLDNCRSEGFLSKDAMQRIFATKNQEIKYSFQYIQQVLQRAQIPKSLLQSAQIHPPD
ncbi:uncharacterized protein LOC117109939 isoform X2 [Anneissia japonica]|uniref:uncharacterized protein LOC117109939 isoform X2 n=1 Tax=Anneissia japonica TaxID=1529436 RepID=UPI00142598AF|nr:uncharacterized protein LOC117109939 isoform X2 [Anneissia japonica]